MFNFITKVFSKNDLANIDESFINRYYRKMELSLANQHLDWFTPKR